MTDEVYRIETSLSIEEALKACANAIAREPLVNDGRLLKGGVCDGAKIEELWRQKSRLDVLFDSGREIEYHRTRDRLFPLDRHGSERALKNRAGDKLIEVSAHTTQHAHIIIRIASDDSDGIFVFRLA